MDEGKYPLALPHGSILNGQYIVGRVLGQGGFGITYLALDHTLKTKVAVKEFLPEGMATRMPGTTLVSAYSGEREENFSYGMERFLDEARVLAKFLGNRNIVGVRCYFNENGTAYFAMDYIEGISFKSYIKNQGGRVSWEDAQRVLLPVMDALAAVHREGIIHRDVTPDNIYITKDDEIKLLDFGSARYSLGDKSKSLDVILKTGYAPKEQYTRRGRQGPYTDVYSLAACFYAALTGYLPPESLERMEEDNLVPPSTRGVRLPSYAEEAIMKGLEVNAPDRFQRMEEFKAAITGTPCTEAPPTWQEAYPSGGTPAGGAGVSAAPPFGGAPNPYAAQPPAGQFGTPMGQPPASGTPVGGAGVSAAPPFSGAPNPYAAQPPAGQFGAPMGQPPAGGTPVSGAGVSAAPPFGGAPNPYAAQPPAGQFGAPMGQPPAGGTPVGGAGVSAAPPFGGAPNPYAAQPPAGQFGAPVGQPAGAAQPGVRAPMGQPAGAPQPGAPIGQPGQTTSAYIPQAPANMPAGKKKGYNPKTALILSCAGIAAAIAIIVGVLGLSGVFSGKNDGGLTVPDTEGYASSEAARPAGAGLEKNPEPGNGIGSMKSSDPLTVKSGWIYYSDNKGSLCRIREDGTDWQVLSEHKGCSIWDVNVLDGWVYYTTYKYDGGESENILWRIPTGGGSSEKLQQLDYGFDSLLALGNYLYFYEGEAGGFCRINTETLQKEEFLKGGNGGYDGNLKYANGQLYYLDGTGMLCSVQLDGAGKETVRSDIVFSYSHSWTVSGNQVYYIDAEDACVYSAGLEGGEPQKVAPQNWDFYVSDDWIYYTGYEDEMFHRVRTDGTGDEVLAEAEEEYFFVTGDYIYCQLSGIVYQWELDGSNARVFGGPANPTGIPSEILFVADTERTVGYVQTILDAQGIGLDADEGLGNEELDTFIAGGGATGTNEAIIILSYYEALDASRADAVIPLSNWKEKLYCYNMGESFAQEFASAFETATLDVHVKEKFYQVNDTATGIYSGYINEEGDPDYYGEIVYNDGDSYAGEWTDFAWDGWGRYTWAEGEYYEGDFVSNDMTGQGAYCYQSGNYYEGSFIEGIKTGSGTFYWTDGDRYAGDFVNDNMEGHGTYYWSDGRYYEGDWKDGVRHGSGVMHYADGTTEQQYWENGTQIY